MAHPLGSTSKDELSVSVITVTLSPPFAFVYEEFLSYCYHSTQSHKQVSTPVENCQ